jgi:hypothetical protein
MDATACHVIYRCYEDMDERRGGACLTCIHECNQMPVLGKQNNFYGIRADHYQHGTQASVIRALLEVTVAHWVV